MKVMPNNQSLVIPTLGPEPWNYLPIKFAPSDMFFGQHLMVVREARLYHFGILSSAMHMAWIKFVQGKIPAFTSFPWPIQYTPSQLKEIEAKAQEILNLRIEYSHGSLARLYDPAAMPVALVSAHAALDRAVDEAYRAPAFESEYARIEFLTKLHQKIASLLMASPEEVIEVHGLNAYGGSALYAANVN